MTLNQLKQVLDSLVELEPMIDGSWGPSVELANERKTAALKILRTELDSMQEPKLINSHIRVEPVYDSLAR